MVNLSARNYQLTISGLDCTPLLFSVDGGYSHYDSSGLILIDATLVLRRTLDWVEELSDRINPRWARGNQIDLKVSDSTGVLRPAPVIGRLYILKAEYDGKRELKIEAGCILNLLNFRTPAGDGACFDLGQTVGLNAIASKLLNKASASSAWAGAVNGASLTVSLPKLTNESYIQLFGKLCWANGYIAYQDNLGFIRTKSVNLYPSAIKSLQVGRDEAKYERLTGVESPVELIRVSGVLNSKKKTEPTITVEEEYGPVSSVNPESGSLSPVLIRRTRTNESINFNTRQIRTEIFVEEPLGIIDPKNRKGSLTLWDSSFTSEIKKYETSPSVQVALGDGNPPDTCQDTDEGKLISISTKINRPFVVSLRDYIEAEYGGSTASLGGELNLILDEQTTTEYSYAEEKDKDTQKIKITPKIVTTTTRPVGAILPNEPYANFPVAHYPAKRVRQSWEETKKDTWKYSEREFQALAIVSPESAESSDPKKSISLGSKLALIQSKSKYITSNSGQTTPPAPERFPPEYEVIEKQLKVEVKLPALHGNPNFRPREKEIVIDGGLLTSEVQARQLGSIEGHILWGRYKGQNCSIAVSDEWFSASPLCGVRWTDLQNRGHLFMADGIALAFVNNRLALAFDGIWCGSSLPGSQDITPPYILNIDIEFGLGLFFESKVYPYSIQPTFVDCRFGVGLGFGCLTKEDIFDLRFGVGLGSICLTENDIVNVEFGLGLILFFDVNLDIFAGLGLRFACQEVVPTALNFGLGLEFNVLETDPVFVGTGLITAVEIASPELFDARIGLGIEILKDDGIDLSFGLSLQSNIAEVIAENIYCFFGLGIEIQYDAGIDLDFGLSLGLDIYEEIAEEIDAYFGLWTEIQEDAGIDLNFGLSIEVDIYEEMAEEINGYFGLWTEIQEDAGIDLGFGLSIESAIDETSPIDINSYLALEALIQKDDGIDLDFWLGVELDISVTSPIVLNLEAGLINQIDDNRSELVTEKDDALVTASGDRLIAYVNDMSYLALQPEVVQFENRINGLGGSIGYPDLVAHNILLQDLKFAGIWHKIQELYTFSGENLTSALVKFKYLVQPNLTNFGIPVPNYNKYIGLKGSVNTSGYLLTGYSPLQNLSNGNSHFGVQVQRHKNTGYLFGCSGVSSANRFGIQLSTNTMFTYTGFSSNSLPPGADFKSFLCLSSTGGVGELCYLTGFDKVRQSTNSAAGLLLDLDMAILARNINGAAGSFCDAAISFFSIGQGLSYPEMVIYQAIVNKFTAALGRS